MIELDKKHTDYLSMLANIPRETIATIAGDPLTIPVEVPASIPLAYARTRLNRGDDIALTWALDLMLTPDGFSRLLESNASDTDLSTITDVVLGRLRGATVGSADEAPKVSTNGARTTRKRAATPARLRAAKK